ncbi:MAG: tRNA adenosine deaminase-associated protein [Nocardioidaceae bacterium]
MTDELDAGIDFAVVAYREEGIWQVVSLPPRAGTDLDVLVHALRQWPGDAGSLGMVSVDEDFFVLARVQGDSVRLLLSDITAATEWPLARGIVNRLELPPPDDEDALQPAGDMQILSDLGFSAMDLAVLCDEDELYPDEMLEDIADHVGFAPQYQSALEAVAT